MIINGEQKISLQQRSKQYFSFIMFTIPVNDTKQDLYRRNSPLIYSNRPGTCSRADKLNLKPNQEIRCKGGTSPDLPHAVTHFLGTRSDPYVLRLTPTHPPTPNIKPVQFSCPMENKDFFFRRVLSGKEGLFKIDVAYLLVLKADPGIQVQVKGVEF